jgi:hypothetical protein
VEVSTKPYEYRLAHRLIGIYFGRVTGHNVLNQRLPD